MSSVADLAADHRRRARAARARARPGCSCARTSTAGTSPAWCTCRGTGTPPRSGCGRRRSCSGRSARRHVDYSVQVGESPVATAAPRCPGRARPPRCPMPIRSQLERAVAAAVRSWDDDLADEAVGRPRRAAGQGAADPDRRHDPGHLQDRRARVGGHRRLRPDPGAARVRRRRRLRAVGVGELRRRRADRGRTTIVPDTVKRVWRLTIYRTGGPITLTDVLPRLQHMGVDVVDEHPYEFPAARAVLDLRLRAAAPADAGRSDAAQQGDLISNQRVREQVEDALAALWDGQIEDDGFNALVLDAQLTWRQVVVLRAYAKYLRQAKRHLQPGLHRAGAARRTRTSPGCWSRLFESRFDPAKEAGRGRAERGHRRGDHAARLTTSPAWTRTGSCGPTWA